MMLKNNCKITPSFSRRLAEILVETPGALKQWSAIGKPAELRQKLIDLADTQ